MAAPPPTAAAAAGGSAAASVWNQGNWHWESKNLNKAAEAELRERLTSISLEGGGVEVRLVAVLKLSVDAAIHVRRGKRVATFDVSFTGRWEGWKAGGPRPEPATNPSGKQAAGEVTVTDVMQDDVGSDFPVQVYMSSISGHNAVDLRSKDVAKAGLPMAIRAQLRAFGTKLAAVAAEADAAAAEKGKREEEARKTAAANADAGAVAERQRMAEQQAERMAATATAVIAAVAAEKEKEKEVKEREGKEAAGGGAGAAAPANTAATASTAGTSTAAGAALALPVPLKVEAAGAAPDVKASEWNAGAWAWETRDLSGWAHVKLTELLSNLELDVPPTTTTTAGGRTITEPGAFLRTIKPDSLKVEASVSLRKGKKLVLFELAAEVPWEGSLVGPDGAALGGGDGVLRIQDLDQDSLTEEGGGYTLAAVADEEGGPVDAALADRFNAHAVPMVKARLRAFAQELQAHTETAGVGTGGGKASKAGAGPNGSG